MRDKLDEIGARIDEVHNFESQIPNTLGNIIEIDLEVKPVLSVPINDTRLAIYRSFQIEFLH